MRYHSDVLIAYAIDGRPRVDLKLLRTSGVASMSSVELSSTKAGVSATLAATTPDLVHSVVQIDSLDSPKSVGDDRHLALLTYEKRSIGC